MVACEGAPRDASRSDHPATRAPSTVRLEPAAAATAGLAARPAVAMAVAYRSCSSSHTHPRRPARRPPLTRPLPRRNPEDEARRPLFAGASALAPSRRAFFPGRRRGDGRAAARARGRDDAGLPYLGGSARSTSTTRTSALREAPGQPRRHGNIDERPRKSVRHHAHERGRRRPPREPGLITPVSHARTTASTASPLSRCAAGGWASGTADATLLFSTKQFQYLPRCSATLPRSLAQCPRRQRGRAIIFARGRRRTLLLLHCQTLLAVAV